VCIDNDLEAGGTSYEARRSYSTAGDRVAVPTLADCNDGLVVYNRGDYVTAVREWWPLAKQGDARAQSALGFMYEYGQGVPQDAATLLSRYRCEFVKGIRCYGTPKDYDWSTPEEKSHDERFCVDCGIFPTMGFCIT
jgi:TPR repeat protein